MKNLLALPLLIMSFAIAHAQEQGQLRDGALQRIMVRFQAMVGTEPFSCGRSYENIGATHSRITPSDFRFYVSEVELINREGKAVPVQLEQDGVWQYRNVALLDFEGGTGPCGGGNSGLHTAVTGMVPKDVYRGVRFVVGVPFDLNHGDPTIVPSPLNFTAMFWAWQSGYKFIKIDMATSGQSQDGEKRPEMSMKERVAMMEKIDAMKKQGAAGVPGGKPPRAAGFSVHIGSTECASASLTTPPSECRNPNRMAVAFGDFDVDKNVIVADLAALLKDTDVDINAPGTAPGCMSAVDDADCPGIFAALGLPYDGQPVMPQRFLGVK